MRGDVRFLTVEQVIRYHDRLLKQFGGNTLPGHRGEWDGVAAAVYAVDNRYYEDLFDLAAAYAVYIVLGHVFGDGNKRAGSGAALAFLAGNGIVLRPHSDDLREAMLEVQERAETMPAPPAAEMVGWLADWLREAPRVK